MAVADVCSSVICIRQITPLDAIVISSVDNERFEPDAWGDGLKKNEAAEAAF
ncbi:MAG: hypothetical protein V4724_33510 [Pseudomonadota bacterium]